MEEQLIFDIWETFRDHIPEKGRNAAADQFVDFLIGNDVELDTLEGLLGYDPHLDTSIQSVLDENKEEEEDEEEDNWSDEEEDY